MSTSTHPEDLDLFEYVEGDLDAARAAAVAAHVEACPRCREEIRLLEAGKQALRESAWLHLPDKRRSLVIPSLPKQEREPRRSPAWTPKRLVAVLAPVAAIAVVVAVVTSTTGGGSDERQVAPAAAEAEAPADRESPESLQAAPAPEPGDASAGGALESTAAPLLEVAGPPEEVARVLRRAGLAVRVTARGVEVEGDPAAAREALSGRPAGDVAVFARP